jgi:hypothetical protein
MEQATADLGTIQASRAQSYQEDRYRSMVSMQSKLADLTGNARPALLMLMGAVLAILADRLHKRCRPDADARDEEAK